MRQKDILACRLYASTCMILTTCILSIYCILLSIPQAPRLRIPLLVPRTVQAVQGRPPPLLRRPPRRMGGWDCGVWEAGPGLGEGLGLVGVEGQGVEGWGRYLQDWGVGNEGKPPATMMLC